MTADALNLGANSIPLTLGTELVEHLAQQGIDTYFGVPGGAIEPLMNSIARAEQLGIARYIASRGEAAAAFAADGYYRETGKMAVCLATTGPGATNLITAVMAADADRIPMLVITPQVPAVKQGRGALQDSSGDGYDVCAMFGRITRYSTAITHPTQIRQRLAHALSKATTERRGPVHLSIPSDLLAGPAAGNVENASLMQPPRAIDTAAVNELLARLSTATRAVIYVGDDTGKCAAMALDVAAARGWEVVSSPAGKRWLPHNDPHYAGVVGFSGHHNAHRAVEQAECVLALGATFDELSTNGWTVFSDKEIYSVDTHWEFGLRLPNVQPVLADPAVVLELLATKLIHCETPSGERRVQLVSVFPCADDGPTHPVALVKWLNEHLGHDVVLHVDAGNSFSWTTRYLRRPVPDTYRVAMGAASMCWAIGATIGSAVASGRRAACLCGDGAMLMSSCELSTAVQRQLPVTFVVLNDGRYGMVAHGQKLSGAAPIGFALGATRFDLMARACGAEGIRVNSYGDLKSVDVTRLRDHHGGPVVIDVVVDPNAVPPIGERVRGLRGSLRP